MLKKVARIGDTAVGHTNVFGAPVVGTITSGSTDTFNGDIGIASSSSIVHFPLHPHDTVDGAPIDFREHFVAITASGKHNVNANKIAREGDIVPVSDIAGPNATIVATQDNLYCV